MQAFQGTLPITSHREEILSALTSNDDTTQVVLIAGDTGCGKSTQVPQMLLTESVLRGRGSEVSIAVTQPRRLAAVALAERVSAELSALYDASGDGGGDGGGGSGIHTGAGTLSGHQVRLHSRVHASNTRLLFMTTGVLLRKLQGGVREEEEGGGGGALISHCHCH
jgi:HrpA-like RNA helicase